MKKLLLMMLLWWLVVPALSAPTETTISDSRWLKGVNDQKLTPVMTVTDQRSWEVIATALAAGDEPNDINTDERTYTLATALAKGGDSKITVVHIPPAWAFIRFRCIGDTNDASVTYQVYSGSLASKSNCELSKVAQLAFTVGGQKSTVADYNVADTLTATEYCKLITIKSDSPAADMVAEAGWDLEGEDILVIVPTVLGCNAKLIAKGFNGD